MSERTEQFEKIAKELQQQFTKKNQHYGDDYFTGNYEPLERWMSIKRKVARLEAHYKLGNKSELPDETLEDTWKDLGIYCIMELILMQMEIENGKK